ncbi:MAG: hypothetical protein ACJAQ4_001504, partial [Cryomorphaceae bacterium]
MVIFVPRVGYKKNWKPRQKKGASIEAPFSFNIFWIRVSPEKKREPHRKSLCLPSQRRKNL